MAAKVVLWGLVVLGLLASVTQSADPSDALAAKLAAKKRLNSIAISDNADAEEICSTFERHLRDIYHNIATHSSRRQILVLAFNDGLLIDDGTKISKALADCTRSDVEHVIGGNASASQPTIVKHSDGGGYEQNRPDVQQDLQQVPVTFLGQDLVQLSQIQYQSKSLPLNERCRFFEETLFQILKNQPQITADRATMFNSVIEALAARKVPLRTEPPFLNPLRECVENLPLYQLPKNMKRTVIAGPNHEVDNLNKPANPMDDVREEFVEVKTRTIDQGEDLYAPKVHDELRYNKNYDNSNEGGSVLSEHETPKHEHYDHEINNEKYEHSAPGFMKEHIADEMLDELIEHEVDPLKKLQMQLDREMRETKWLRDQLEDSSYKVSDLRAQLAELEASRQLHAPNVIEKSRLEEMNLLLNQANDRERRATEKVELMTRRIAELEAKLVMAERFYNDDDSDDDDDDDDDDDGDDDEVYKKSKKLRKAMETSKKAKNEKVYKDPKVIARKLQDKMNSSELPANRCQKYYMILNYSGKVTKRTIKTVAKLNLPTVVSNDPEFYKSLQHFADLMSQSSHKGTRLAAGEMKQCQMVEQRFGKFAKSRFNSIDSIDHEPGNYWEQSSPTARNIPVKFVNKQSGGFGSRHSWLGNENAGVAASTSASYGRLGGQAQTYVFPRVSIDSNLDL